MVRLLVFVYSYLLVLYRACILFKFLIQSIFAYQKNKIKQNSLEASMHHYDWLKEQYLHHLLQICCCVHHVYWSLVLFSVISVDFGFVLFTSILLLYIFFVVLFIFLLEDLLQWLQPCRQRISIVFLKLKEKIVFKIFYCTLDDLMVSFSYLYTLFYVLL